MKGETAAGLQEVAAMIVRIVRFKSELSDDQVQAVMEGRAPRYQEVPGLAQKYYLRFSDPREYGAVYVWDSEQSLKNFNDSELARSIPDAYQVEGAPEGEVAEVMLVLRPDPDRAAHSH